jgi:hypothetical protein
VVCTFATFAQTLSIWNLGQSRQREEGREKAGYKLRSDDTGRLKRCTFIAIITTYSNNLLLPDVMGLIHLLNFLVKVLIEN